MNKLYDRIDFHNGTTPALNETNLNAMSKAIDDIDSRILTMGDVITALESSATASANSASASATSASASATSASSSATSASNSATSASASASSASSSATSAQASAEEARRFTPTGYDELVNDVSSVKSDLSNFVDGGYLPKNLWDEEWEVGGVNNSTGEKYVRTDRIRSVNFIKVKPSTKYYICASVGNFQQFFYTSAKAIISNRWGVNGSFETPSNCEYMLFTSNEVYGTVYKNDVAIFEGEVAQTYIPYAPSNFEITSLKSDLSYYEDNGYLSKNIANRDNILNGYPDAGGVTKEANFVSSSATRSIWFACKPNTTYTVSTSVAMNRNNVYTCANVPRIGESQLWSLVKGYSNQTTYTFTSNSNPYICIYLANNNDIDNATIQIEEGTSASAYTPYCPPNTEITSVKKSLLDAEERGYYSPNLLECTLETTTSNGVTCTNLGDGTYRLNGTASANTDFNLFGFGTRVYKLTLSGTYKIIGFNNSTNKRCIQVFNSDWSVNIGTNDTYSKVANGNFTARIYCGSGETFNNEIVKPMLVDADKYPNIGYSDFVKYIPSNSTIKTALTPQFLTSSITNNTSYVNNLGNTSVIKIGNIAIVSLHFNLSTQGTNGALLISGLPKNASGKILYTNIVSTSSMIGLQMNNGDNKLYCTNNATVGWYCGQLIYCTE